MSATVLGIRKWSARTDPDGNRTYKIVYHVKVDSKDDGPVVAQTAAGLPLVGSYWLFGNDVDIWAFCLPEVDSDPEAPDGEPNFDWYLTYTFSTKHDAKRCQDTPIEDPLLEPPQVSGGGIKYTEEAITDRNGNDITSSSYEQLRGPQNEWDANRPTVRISINTPLLYIELWSPMINTLNDSALWGLPARCIKLSDVSWVRKFYGTCNYYYTLTFDFDIFAKSSQVGVTSYSVLSADVASTGAGYLVGDILTVTGGTSVTPALLQITELFVGGAVKSVAVLDGGEYTVLPTSPVSVTGGLGAGATFNLSFGVLLVSGFDRDLQDEGTKVLFGHWDENFEGRWVLDPAGYDGAGNPSFDNPVWPDPFNPTHFQRYQDRDGNWSRLILNGYGLPAGATIAGTGTHPDTSETEPGKVHVEKYGESNFLLLGIPTVLA